MPSIHTELMADTVSFSGKNKVAKQVVHTLSDAFDQSYDNALAKRKAIARKFIDTISAITEEVDGISFDRKFYEKTVLKSKKSFLSKLKRSGAAPLDKIRTTIFNNDIYNFSILTKFLKKLNERGYDIMMIEGERCGKKVLSWLPDLDIRLDDVPEQEIKKLPPILRDTVSRQLPSGLSDIQMRIIDKNAQDPEPIEIIIMLGKESAKAKQIEEDDIYQYLRVLKDELHVSKIKKYDAHSPLKRINLNTGIVASTLRNSISKPMYTNAASMDIDNKKLGLKVGIQEESGKVLKGLLEGIRNKIQVYYNAEIKKAKTLPNKEEAEKLIDNLNMQYAEDLQNVINVQNGLNATIDKYSYKV